MDKFLPEEMETILTFSKVDKKWYAYTNIKKDFERLSEAGWKVTKNLFYEDGAFKSADLETDNVGSVLFRKKREFSDEQRAAQRERMKNIRRKVE